jgi:enamine deaminase RidA (YjgF/YER057c/UK114 family)
VIETTDYVTTFEGYERTAAVRREVFGDGPFPAATGVRVAGLVRPGALIEIRALAWLGDRE